MKYLLVLILVLNCASAKTVTYDPYLPDPSYGCSNVKGTGFFECMKKQSSRWDKIESSIPTDEIVSEEREGNYVIRKIKHCRYDLCDPIKTEKIYSPTLLYLIGEKSVFTAIGILIGKII